MAQIQRHNLVWLDPDLDPAPYTAAPEQASFVREWIALGQPLVVARQPRQQVTGAPHIALGLTHPPPATRRRISVYVPAEAILRQSGPLELTRALPHAPLWEEAIQRILFICKGAAVTPCVYGSLMWQAVSRYNYLTNASDLDLLFVCTDSSDIKLLIDSLASCEVSTPRLDGEILVPSGWAAAWREVATACNAGGSSTVLAKSGYGARLFTLDEFLG
ncbi:MAG: malonate decarboxylase holo-[acyl-carrier-protein] synthase [Desulfuromonadaceae bacterium]|nr:malonate decarboxylase holo-[acyl-carrier-protein] synthase [Desulfuromonadaceae bacterium]